MINTMNPVLLNLGAFEIRWYGLFLGLGVALGLWILIRLFKNKNLNPDEALNIGVWLTLGGLVGARIGHIIFYNLDYYLSNPLEIFMIHHGGLSSHGMTIGLIIAFALYVRIKKIDWRKIIDLLVIPIPLIAGFIRIGNYFNSEIVGRATDLPWAVQFPLYELSPIERHPSQIYEALVAFAIFAGLLWLYRRARVEKLVLTHTFILLYFSTRFLIEYVKEYHTLEAGLTMGQWLSLPFVIYATGWFAYRFLRNK